MTTAETGPSAMARLGRLMAVGLLAATVALAPGAPALAVDLTGKTLTAEGISERAANNGADKTFTYVLEIYFSEKGNRFVLMKATSGSTRVLIKAGENRGSKRRKDGNFNQIVTLQQSASAVQLDIESRGTTDGYAGEGFSFDISLSGGSCRVTEFKYAPDPRQFLSKSRSKEGNCTIKSGAPEGLEDK